MSPPRHLALIPDGNRRWARAAGRTVAEGHRAGIENIGQIADHAFANGVEVVSFWWGSPSNLLHRAPEEVDGILSALERWLGGDAQRLLARWGARFDAWGRIEEICPRSWPAIGRAREVAGPGPRRLVLLLAYDGRDEIAAAIAAGAPPTVPGIGEHLWTGGLPPVDLLLRTGGEPHLSAGFLMWHLAEACLAFPAPCWPAFTVEDLGRELLAYGTRQRRFGR